MPKRKAQSVEVPATMRDMITEALENPGMIAECFNQFRDYSWNNCMLAYCQCMVRGIAFGPIATYKKWSEQGRQVRRGEKAIVLLQPFTFKAKDRDGQEITDDDGSSRMITKFIARSRWFVLSQTDGEVEPVQTVDGWDHEKAMHKLGILLLAFEYPDGNCLGFAKGKGIAVSDLAPNKLAVIYHEMAHVVLGHTAKDEVMADGPKLERGHREVEAEMVAYLLRNIHGTATDQELAESRGYIQNWLARTSDDKMLDASVGRVMKAVNEILKAGSLVESEVEVA